MLDLVRRVVLAYQKRPTKVMKKRTPADRLKSRLYYRKNKNKMRLARRRYNHKTKIFSKVRKLNKRPKPSWMHKALSGSKSKSPRKPGLIKKFIKRMTSPPKLTHPKVKLAPKVKRYKVDVPR